MTEIPSEIADQIEELNDPVVVPNTDLEELREKAEKYDDVSEDISELRERTSVLDDVDRSQVDELSEADDPEVVESERLASLEEEAQQVKQIYADDLAEELGVFTADELIERFDIEELSEKHDEHVGGMEESLNPDPKGTDPEELNDGSSNKGSKEELSEEISQKQEELKNKILN